MNFSTQRVINNWTREVETEMCDLIERGVPPIDAAEQARKNVQKRRAAKAQGSKYDA